MMKPVLKAFLMLVALGAALLVVTFIWIGSRGISARAETWHLVHFIRHLVRITDAEL
jgi:hypothetical protein